MNLLENTRLLLLWWVGLGLFQGNQFTALKNVINYLLYVIMVEGESAQLASAQMQQMSEIMLNGIKSQILPSVITECMNFCTGELFPKMKRELLSAAEKLVAEATNELREQVQRKQFTQEDAIKFMQDNRETFNKHEEIQDDAYWKATGYYEIVKLYEQSLNETPVYVPKKFRRDRYHIMSAAELEILQRREENELKSEIEVFKLREERNRKIVELQDDLVTIFVNERIQNPYLKETVLRAWNDKNRNEMERVTGVWYGKIEGVRKAFNKDKEYIRRHNETRVKKQRDSERTRRIENSVENNPNRITFASSNEYVRASGNGTVVAEREPPEVNNVSSNEYVRALVNGTVEAENEPPEGNSVSINEYVRASGNRAVVAEREHPEVNNVMDSNPANEEDITENQVNDSDIPETPQTEEAEEADSNPLFQLDASAEPNYSNTTSLDSNTGNGVNGGTSEATPASQEQTATRSAILEVVESDENFTDDEFSQVLFEDSQDVRNRNNLATLASDTSEDDTDDEDNGAQQDFQRGSHPKKKRRKARNSYSPQVTSLSQTVSKSKSTHPPQTQSQPLVTRRRQQEEEEQQQKQQQEQQQLQQQQQQEQQQQQRRSSRQKSSTSRRMTSQQRR